MERSHCYIQLSVHCYKCIFCAAQILSIIASRLWTNLLFQIPGLVSCLSWFVVETLLLSWFYVFFVMNMITTKWPFADSWQGPSTNAVSAPGTAQPSPDIQSAVQQPRINAAVLPEGSFILSSCSLSCSELLPYFEYFLS